MQATLDTHPKNDLNRLQCRELVGVDIFKDYLTFLSKRDVQTVQLDLTCGLPFSDDSFDVVLLLDILEHLPTLKSAETLLKESKRIAQKKVIVYTPSKFVSQNIEGADSWVELGFKPNSFQQHKILINKSLLIKHNFKVKEINGHKALYGVCDKMPKQSLLQKLLKRNQPVLDRGNEHDADNLYWRVYNGKCSQWLTATDESLNVAVALKHKLPNSVVLDLGCGIGRLNRTFPIKEYHGLDTCSQMLKKAREHNQNRTNCYFHLGNGKNLHEFADNYFDIVIANALMLHLKVNTVKCYAREIYRVLKPQGIFITHFPKQNNVDIPKVFSCFQIKQLKEQSLEKILATDNVYVFTKKEEKTFSDKLADSNAIITEAFKRFNKIGLAFSGGTDSLVMLNIVHPYKLDIPVIFVHTQDEFPETVQFIHETADKMKLNLIEVKAPENMHNNYRERYKNDKAKFIEECCLYHKITPLLQAIQDLKLEACFVGIRGSEHEERRKAGVFEQKIGHVRVHPLMQWTLKDALTFVDMYGLQVNPLYKQGYVSLGCQYCTQKSPELVERGGRDKTREVIMKTLREAGYT